MAQININNARFIVKNDTKANWLASSLVLLKGEMALESDTGKFKFGDGTHTFSEIESYAGTVVANSPKNGIIVIDGVEQTVYELPVANAEAIGGIKAATATEGVYATGAVQVDANGNATVAKVADAEKLETARTISVTGDVTGSTTFDGSANATINVALATNASLDATKNYVKIKVNNKGIVTEGAETINVADILDAGTAASLNAGTAAGNVPVLNAEGKLENSVIPQIAIMDTEVVANKTAMLALTNVQKGDVAIVTGENKTYILAGTDPSVETNWKQILTPLESVNSVNGKQGVVVLTTTDIAEGNNLYYTDARVATKVGTMNSTELADGATILHSTDALVFDAGNSSAN